MLKALSRLNRKRYHRLIITLKRVAFARHYALSGNGSASAIAAGYAPGSAHVTASRLLKVANVAAAIEAERGRLRERSDLVADDVIHGLRKIAEDESAPHSSRVQSWKILGQHLGMFTDRLHVEHSLRVPELAGIPLSELIAMRETLVKALPEPVEAEARVLDS